MTFGAPQVGVRAAQWALFYFTVLCVLSYNCAFGKNSTKTNLAQLPDDNFGAGPAGGYQRCPH